VKSKEHATIQQSFNMLEKEKIGNISNLLFIISHYVLQICWHKLNLTQCFNLLALENQVDHLKISLAEEKSYARVIDELLKKCVKEKEQLKNNFVNATKQPEENQKHTRELQRTQQGGWVGSSCPCGQQLQLQTWEEGEAVEYDDEEDVEETVVVVDNDDDEEEEGEEVQETVVVDNDDN
jgi:hypothetical protein